MRTKLQSSTLIILILTASVLAQNTISVADRKENLTTIGKVSWRSSSLSVPSAATPGAVRTLSLRSADFGVTNLSGMRIRFKVSSGSSMSGWTISVVDANGNIVWTYDPSQGNGNSFWSDEVKGNEATVRITGNTSPDVLVDAIAPTQTPITKAVSITPPTNGLTPIDGPTVSDLAKRIGKSVARLRFIGDDGNQYVCTGFLVSSDLLMTNHHCPQSESEWRSTMVDFDYDKLTSIPKVARFKEFVISDAELDFAIFRLTSAQTGRTALKLVGTIPATTVGLQIVQHPGGQPKQVSVENCRSDSALIPGVTAKATDFAHMCDTIGGTSGSAVTDPNGNVVGLHHLGFRNTDVLKANRAVAMQKIIEFVVANRPDIKAEIGL